jgi:hypothetical protein
MSRRESEPSKNDGELSLGDLDTVAGGVPAGPDVCETSAPGTNVPTPYPNTGSFTVGLGNLYEAAKEAASKIWPR